MTFSRCSSAVAIVLTLSSAAFAESARAAYSRGLSLYSTGQFAEAAQAFLAAYERRPKPLILFNVGQAYRKSGDFERALIYYRRFLDDASLDERAPLEEETRKYVHEIEAEQALRHSLSDKADREEASALHFGRPAAPSPPPPTIAASSLDSPVARPVAVAPMETGQAHTTRRPLAQRWWFWTSLGTVAVGVAVGLGVGLGSRSNDPSTALGTRQPSY